MLWFWFGFFAFVALLLFIDLGVINKKAKEPTLKSALYWTIGWMSLGLAFTGFVYLMFDRGWMGVYLTDPKTGLACPVGHSSAGGDAAVMYVSAYLLEQALSIDNIFVISLLFTNFRVPAKYQHRVLFWGILGAIVFRIAMLGGGAFLVAKFTWIFYVFGAYLAYQGVKLLKHDDEEAAEAGHDKILAVRLLRRFIPIVDGDHGGKFVVMVNGRKALTTIAVCLVVVELTDIVFALDSIPAVLSVSQETFIMITSNIFAIMGLRSLYFVLAGAMAQFKYLKIALAILLMLIGAKMIAHHWWVMPHVLSLILIAGIIGTGVIASIVSTKRLAKLAPATPVEPEPEPAARPEAKPR